MSKRPPSLAESMKALAERPQPLPVAVAPPVAINVERKPYHAATREGLVKVTTGVDVSVRKSLKRLSIDQDKSVEDLIREAIDDLLTKYAERS